MSCKNVGKKEKVVRTVIGFAMIGAGIYFKSWWGAIGVIPLLSAVIGYCPIAALCGFSSISSSETGEQGKGCCGGHHVPDKTAEAKS